MNFSWMGMAFGLISLKRKTDDQKPDTLLKMRVSGTTGRNFEHGSATIFMYEHDSIATVIKIVTL